MTSGTLFNICRLAVDARLVCALMSVTIGNRTQKLPDHVSPNTTEPDHHVGTTTPAGSGRAASMGYQLLRSARKNSAPLAGRAGPSVPTAHVWLEPGTTASAANSSAPGPDGFAVDASAQLPPFQCSASVR